MSLIDSIKEVRAQKKSSINKPLFYKSDSDLKNQVEKLEELEKNAHGWRKTQIREDIRMYKAGIVGENNVEFELKNSYLPIIVLHDLCLNNDDLSVQIDYLVITRKIILIIECKNLIGNIEVNANGEFIRTMEYGGKLKKEGIYSPITQNARHLDMIKKIKSSRAKNVIYKTAILTFFDDNYKSVVVLANPKTIINMKYAKKEIKDQIIRADQLIDYIKQLEKQSKNEPSSDKHMHEIAESFMSLHTPNTTDYTKKYGVEENGSSVSTEKDETIRTQPLKTAVSLEETPLYKELRRYRLETCRKEGCQAYVVFNNRELQEIITAMPQTLDDIAKISGFGKAKCEKHGPEILEIVKKH